MIGSVLSPSALAVLSKRSDGMIWYVYRTYRWNAMRTPEEPAQTVVSEGFELRLTGSGYRRRRCQ